MTQKYFITFGSNQYVNSANRIIKEAENFKIFSSIKAYFNADLEKYEEFWNQHKNFIKQNSRGGGYWVWKSFLILETLKNIEDNDILVYCDAGCELKISGLDRLKEYFNMVNESEYGILNFELPYLEDRFTKMDTILSLDALNLSKTNQLLSGIIILRKCPHSVKIIEEWYKYSQNYHLINDIPSYSKNVEYFEAHRHDQSIYSILCKKYGSVIIRDETWPFDDKNWDLKFPIWATRKK
jgi:hypothetical protein